MSDDENTYEDYDAEPLDDYDDLDELEEPEEPEEPDELVEDADNIDNVDEPAHVEEIIDDRKEFASAPQILKDANKPRVAIYVPADERKSSNALSRSEKARILAVRAEQIAAGEPYFGPEIDPPPASAAELAKHELLSRKCPLRLDRVMAYTAEGNPIKEVWDINTMAFPTI